MKRVAAGCKCRLAALGEAPCSPNLLAGFEGHFAMGERQGKGKLPSSEINFWYGLACCDIILTSQMVSFI